MMQFNSPYDSDEVVADVVATGGHRDFVGGQWDELGIFQLKLLQSFGLHPEHTLLDVGCGALRGGIRFAEFLNSGNYYGQDLRPELIEAGYINEVIPSGLDLRLPRQNLVASQEFDFSQFDQSFDFALAFSVFTHISLNSVRICLEKIHPSLNEGGRFFATFFERPAETLSYPPILQPPGIITTQGAKDPYHYTLSDFRFAAAGLPLKVTYIGEIGHPRGQKAVMFEKFSATTENSARLVSPDQVSALPPGADHYRAYVGPPARFDIMSGSQFALLFQLGLRDYHSVLDFGCGSLRLGRLLIPFLQPERYHGIDPNAWLIEDGIANELGTSAVTLKKPRFSYDENFNCSVFGEKFDFIVAQSIVTHTGPEMSDSLFRSASESLKDDGLLVFSYIDAEKNTEVAPATSGWHYPHCVSYSEEEIRRMLTANGLVTSPLIWNHPGASWYMAAKTIDALPSDSALSLLNGVMVR